MGSKKSQVVGWRYYFGIHMGIGKGPVDALKEIKVGDRTAWVGDVKTNQTISIDAYNLFGGEEKEGGVQGSLDVMMGESGQIASSGLRAMLGEAIPGFRRMFTVFYNGLVSMNNPYPKPWKFRLNRTLKGWDGPVWEPAYAVIPIADSNQSFSTVFLNMPLDAPGATNLGAATIVHPERFATSSLNYGGGGMELQPGEGLVTEVTPDSSLLGGAFYFWNIGDFDILQFDAIEQSIDVDGYDLDAPGSYVRAFEGSIGVLTTFGFYDPIYFLIESGVFDITGLKQFRIFISGGLGVTATQVNIGAPASLRIRISHNLQTKRSTVFINGVETISRLWRPDTATFSDIRLSTLRADVFARFKNYRVSGLRFSSASAMNPAHIIYECLTNREWGRGLARSKLDESSFQAAALTLFNENFGLCLKWTRKDSIANFIQGVLDHIGATLYQSRITGLMTLKLIRADYDINALPVLTTESGLLEIRDVTVAGPGKSVNAVTVTWHDPLTDEDRTVSVKNPAAVLQNGGAINSVSKSYKGVPTAALALRLAQRDLRAVSTNLRKFSITADTSLDVVHPGDVLVIEDAKRGIPKMAVRVGRVRDGTLINGQIALDVVQDVFGLPAQGFAVEVPNTYTPPDTKPCVDEQLAFEVPYFLLASRMTPADLDYVREDGGYLGVVASKGKAINQGVQVAVRDSAPTPDDDPIDNSYVCGI